METEQTTLRDSISAAFDTVVTEPAEPVQPVETAEPAPVETLEQKAGRTANRLRDGNGRLLPGKKEEAPPVETPAEVKRLARPSSWKKDYEADWEKLDPRLAEYIHQRESEFAKGVSTYKQEAESARTLNDAIAPFLPNLQKHGLQPTQWIQNLGMAHERLALGSPQEKTHMAAQLIRDYGIDPQALFQTLSQPYTPAPQPMDVRRTVQELLQEERVTSELHKFESEAQEKYPFYSDVKGTMAGLLQAGLAQDLVSAYEAALRHPRHADLFEQLQQQQQAEADKQKQAQQQAVVNRARAQAVSVKSSTPAGQMATQGNKSLRDTLADAFESVESSRV